MVPKSQSTKASSSSVKASRMIFSLITFIGKRDKCSALACDPDVELESESRVAQRSEERHFAIGYKLPSLGHGSNRNIETTSSKTNRCVPNNHGRPWVKEAEHLRCQDNFASPWNGAAAPATAEKVFVLGSVLKWCLNSTYGDRSCDGE